jgi:hypothetical protein
MVHGGKREGAGRKKGSTTKKTRQIAERYMRSGKVTPLEVLLTAMERSFEQDDYETAGRFAEKAAPYCHARLSSVEHKKPPVDLSKLSDAELQFLDSLYERAGPAPNGEPQDGAPAQAGIAGPGGNGTRH